MIYIDKASVNNLKNVSLKISKNQLTCFVGKSGSGKTSLVFDVIYKACSSKIATTPKYHISETPEAFAMPQRIVESHRKVSVAKYIGLTSFLKKQGKKACKSCFGSGIAYGINKHLFKASINEIRKHVTKVDDLSFLSTIHEKELAKSYELRKVIETNSLTEDSQAILDLICEIKTCPNCSGYGCMDVKSKDFKNFFNTILGPDYVEDIFFKPQKIQLGQPIAKLSSAEHRWTRVLYLLLKIKPDSVVIFDEPTVGMCSKDAEDLLSILVDLKKQNCTVLLIEHSTKALAYSDNVVVLGPNSGVHGGQIIFNGPSREYLEKHKILKQKFKEIQSKKRQKRCSVIGINQYGFKNETIEIPLMKWTCIAGSMGTGKSGLLNALFRAYSKRHNAWLNKYSFDSITGRSEIRNSEYVSQSPIGKTPHSVPITYINGLLPMRKIFFQASSTQKQNLTLSSFSFNTKDGKCIFCNGYGGEYETINGIQIWNTCEKCNGKRYNEKVLKIKISDYSIADILQLTVEEAYSLPECSPIEKRLKFLKNVGLGYLGLGQPASTLSGGEAQRIKLAKHLGKRLGDRMLYILDNPSKGLSHFDAEQLISVLEQLAIKNTVVVADNNPHFIKRCQHLIIVDTNKNRTNKITYSGVAHKMPKKYNSTFF